MLCGSRLTCMFMIFVRGFPFSRWFWLCVSTLGLVWPSVDPVVTFGSESLVTLMVHIYVRQQGRAALFSSWPPVSCHLYTVFLNISDCSAVESTVGAALHVMCTSSIAGTLPKNISLTICSMPWILPWET